MSSPIDANFDSGGNTAQCCSSKSVVLLDNKTEYQWPRCGAKARKKAARASLPGFLVPNIKSWTSAGGKCSWSSFESVPWSNTQYLGCTGRYCWLIGLMLLLLLYSHCLLSRGATFWFFEAYLVFWESGRPWYTHVESTEGGGVGTLEQSERMLCSYCTEVRYRWATRTSAQLSQTFLLGTFTHTKDATDAWLASQGRVYVSDKVKVSQVVCTPHVDARKQAHLKSIMQ